jgi:peroxiredoxin
MTTTNVSDLETDTSQVPIPAITMWITNDTSIVIGDYQGTSNLLLYFMRAAICPICRQHVSRIAALATEERYGARTLIIVPEGQTEARMVKESLRLPCDVAAGAEGTVHTMFGLSKRLFGSVQQSGTLLLSPGNMVLMRHQASFPPMAYDQNKTLHALKTFARSDVNAMNS